MTSFMASQGVSSSSSVRRWTYDVFLSFRGEDTRHNFTIHLNHALRMKGINTFIDDDDLKRGDEISPALLKAIEESRISIVVFSKNYASSKWCLDELLKIVETEGQMVLPVFYKLDPSDVRYQKNSCEKALDKHKERFKDDEKTHKWKAALTQVANLSGWNSKNYRNDIKFIEELVHEVSRIMNHTYLHVANHPVGIESRAQKIISLLSIHEKKDVRMVGILGAGGIGKTTIAKDIYNSIASRFEGSCFLPNVRETRLVKLQNTLLLKILGRNMKVYNVNEGIIMIKKRLCSKRILLILDDVDDKLAQLDKLAGEVDWFGLGSRIIITTRDKKVLTNHGVVDDLIYKVKELGSNEALELFCWNAFKEDKPPDDFLKLVKDAISYAGGLPLALKVLGSYLHRKEIHKWKSALNKYKSIPHENILERLKISYNGLHPNEQNIFLDITCFFIGRWNADDIKMLDSFDYSSIDGIDVLIERSLITIDENKMLEMHNLLRDMGREVVRQESAEDPGQRSRLWFHKDVREVLEDDTGTNKIQGILVDLPEGEDMVHLSSKAFENMRNLRLLMVSPNAHFSTGPNFLPNKLRVLDWPNCPLQSLPSNFRGRDLIVLRMPQSPLNDLKGIKNFQSMKNMNFGKCKFLKTIPDVSSIPNLEDLNLNDCKNLVEIHHSVGRLDKLVKLSVNFCYNLCNFPRSIQMRSLKDLSLHDCSGIYNFPEIECEMEHLKFIDLGGTSIKEVPLSIRYLTGLRELILKGCINLTNLPSSIYRLQHLEYLNLSGCSKLAKFPEKMGDSTQSMPPPTISIEHVSNDDCSSKVFPALKGLSLSDCVLLESDFLRIFNCYSTLNWLELSGSGIVTIPACIKRFVALNYLFLHSCKQLQEIQAFPPNLLAFDRVDARGCMSLELYNKYWLPELPVAVPVGSGIELEASSIQEHREKRHFDIVVSGNKIPDWFSYRKEVSNSNSCEIDIDVPADMDGEISRVVFSAVIETEGFDASSIWIYVISDGVEIYRDCQSLVQSLSDWVWLRFYVPEPCELKEYNGHLRVKFVHEDGFYPVRDLRRMKSCGVHLVRRCEEKAKDSIGGVHEVTKRPGDDDDHDDDNFESNCYPRQKRPSSTLGIRISDTEAEAEAFYFYYFLFFMNKQLH